MRFATILPAIGVLIALSLSSAMAATQPKIEHPGNIALIEESDGFTYRHAATGFRLYVNDRDPPGKSTCNGGCARAWIPLEVESGDLKPVGDWKIIVREDKSRQWAYKDKPAYTLFHDSSDRPVGNGVEGVWHFLEP